MTPLQIRLLRHTAVLFTGVLALVLALIDRASWHLTVVLVCLDLGLAGGIVAEIIEP